MKTVIFLYSDFEETRHNGSGCSLSEVTKLLDTWHISDYGKRRQIIAVTIIY